MGITMEKENSIGIALFNLNTKERATFERVIAFNMTHGLQAHYVDDIRDANLIITTESGYAQNEEINQNVTTIVISSNSELGDFQVPVPIMITRVMKAMEGAINEISLAQAATETVEKPDTSESSDTTAAMDTSDTTDTTDTSDTTDTTDTTTVSIEDTSHTTNKVVSETQNAQNQTALQDENLTSRIQGHHALVIDDSASIRKQLELELRDAGITADFAESGEQALEKIKETQFDLVFLDIIMPGIDGYETCKAMRATTEYKKTPIIMLSGKTSPLDEVQGVIAGATTYLTKPVKSAMLQETLNRVTKWIDNYANTENRTTTTA